MTKRKILKLSINSEIRGLYKLTIAKHLEEERLLQYNSKGPGKAKKQLAKETADTIMRNMEGLKEQNTIITFLRKHCTVGFINKWYELTEDLSSNTYKFSRKALIFSLAKSNLKRWNKTTDDKCLLCQQKQTQFHVLNNCSVAADDGRYTWRHDSILFTLLYYVKQLTSHGFTIFADLEGFSSPTELFNRMRPDIVLIKDDNITTIELTCCFETNIQKSNAYKKAKYEHLQTDCRKNMTVEKLFVEITALGFIPKSIEELNTFLKKYNIDTLRLNLKMSEVALRTSYYIYTQRNTKWKYDQKILKFY